MEERYFASLFGDNLCYRSHTVNFKDARRREGKERRKERKESQNKERKRKCQGKKCVFKYTSVVGKKPYLNLRGNFMLAKCTSIHLKIHLWFSANRIVYAVTTHLVNINDLHKTAQKLNFLSFIFLASLKRKYGRNVKFAIQSWDIISLVYGKKHSKLGNSCWNENIFLKLDRFIDSNSLGVK